MMNIKTTIKTTQHNTTQHNHCPFHVFLSLSLSACFRLPFTDRRTDRDGETKIFLPWERGAMLWMGRRRRTAAYGVLGVLGFWVLVLGVGDGWHLLFLRLPVGLLSGWLAGLVLFYYVCMYWGWGVGGWGEYKCILNSCDDEWWRVGWGVLCFVFCRCSGTCNTRQHASHGHDHLTSAPSKQPNSLGTLSRMVVGWDSTIQQGKAKTLANKRRCISEIGTQRRDVDLASQESTLFTTLIPLPHLKPSLPSALPTLANLPAGGAPPPEERKRSYCAAAAKFSPPPPRPILAGSSLPNEVRTSIR